MAGTDHPDSAVEWANGNIPVSAVTLHDSGSIVADATGAHRIPAAPVPRVVDTTGAGDAYAAGFLGALAKGSDVPQAGRQGAKLAASVLSHFGARNGPAARALSLPAA